MALRCLTCGALLALFAVYAAFQLLYTIQQQNAQSAGVEVRPLPPPLVLFNFTTATGQDMSVNITMRSADGTRLQYDTSADPLADKYRWGKDFIDTDDKGTDWAKGPDSAQIMANRNVFITPRVFRPPPNWHFAPLESVDANQATFASIEFTFQRKHLDAIAATASSYDPVHIYVLLDSTPFDNAQAQQQPFNLAMLKSNLYAKTMWGRQLSVGCNYAYLDMPTGRQLRQTLQFREAFVPDTEYFSLYMSPQNSAKMSDNGYMIEIGEPSTIEVWFDMLSNLGSIALLCILLYTLLFGQCCPQGLVYRHLVRNGTTSQSYAYAPRRYPSKAGVAPMDMSYASDTRAYYYGNRRTSYYRDISETSAESQDCRCSECAMMSYKAIQRPVEDWGMPNAIPTHSKQPSTDPLLSMAIAERAESDGSPQRLYTADQRARRLEAIVLHLDANREANIA
ncbi:hypothetical protein THASP1DRAFT_28915 [Thamnocephalis sphaerospora]|uniref:Uncharacterized protein n=1 Tax=Thamnocephalis sphaerospora TaxID=78915 RepID=A0A4P9XV54_9FUNG|nr:hypothetical protein THASP1DRAFT_28915 [Thamnocephalis sphaerospora]|eukprot:RKP09290.1 hypothetical protein THASP1DRAFT_28915 [Thamnocephalis sphaerospora]